MTMKATNNRPMNRFDLRLKKLIYFAIWYGYRRKAASKILEWDLFASVVKPSALLALHRLLHAGQQRCFRAGLDFIRLRIVGGVFY